MFKPSDTVFMYFFQFLSHLLPWKRERSAETEGKLGRANEGVNARVFVCVREH